MEWSKVMKVKQHLSVLMLAARSTVYKILGLFLLTAAAQGALFHFAFRRVSSGGFVGFEHLINESRIIVPGGACFVSLCLLLSLTGSEFGGSKVGYSLKRLSVKEETTAFWWAIYNSGCFFLFWVFQATMAFFLCRVYLARVEPSLVTRQTMFLAFYRNSFLHSLLPLDESSRFLRNIIFVLSLGVCTSLFSWYQRRGKMSGAILGLAAMVLVSFSKPIGHFASDMFVSIVALSIAVSSVAHMRREEGF